MSVETAVAKFNQIFDEAKAEIEKSIEVEVKEILKDDHPDHSYSYIGYTPSFNDGDPCYHRSFMDEDYDDVIIHDEEQYYENYRKLEKLFNSIPESIENAIWDTDYRLILSKNGITKDYYDCGY